MGWPTLEEIEGSWAAADVIQASDAALQLICTRALMLCELFFTAESDRQEKDAYSCGGSVPRRSAVPNFQPARRAVSLVCPGIPGSGMMEAAAGSSHGPAVSCTRSSFVF